MRDQISERIYKTNLKPNVLQDKGIQIFLLLFFITSSQVAIGEPSDRVDTWGTSSQEYFYEPRAPYIINMLGLGEGNEDANYKNQLKKCSQEPDNLACRTQEDFLTEANNNKFCSQFWSSASSALVFGERHIDQSHQFNLAKLLPRLYADGYRVLGLEMFNYRDQKFLDMYSRYEITIDDILVVLKSDWNPPQEGYREILLTARRLGLRLVAIDDRDTQRKYDDFSADLIYRDQVMATQIQPYLTEKVILYLGRIHAIKTFLPDEGDEVPTIIEHLIYFQPDLKVENFLFYDEKNSGLFNTIVKSSNQSVEVFKSPTLNELITGFINGSPLYECPQSL